MIQKKVRSQIFIVASFLTCIYSVHTASAREVLVYIHGSKFFGVDKAIALYKKWRDNDIINSSVIPKGLSSQLIPQTKSRLNYFSSTLNRYDHEFIKKENILLFGWSGSLLPSRREYAAHMLHRELKKLFHLYAQTPDPITKLTILTHSHGGNVALILVHILETEGIPCAVDQLIMMGCPIQKITSDYAYSPAVKKIISIYSENDGVQKNDPQIVYPEAFKDGSAPPILSKRTFKNHAPHLWQIQLSINGISYGHSHFTTKSVLSHIPSIMHKTEQLSAGAYAFNVITDDRENLQYINAMPLSDSAQH